MSGYLGPNGVESGLILCLDSSDKNSYPGSGTTWYNLGTSDITTTIYGTPSFINSNGGYFDFDCVDNAMLTSTTLPEVAGLNADAAYKWSTSCWFKFPTNPVDRSAAITAYSGNMSFAILGASGGIAGGATYVLYIGCAGNDGYNGSVANALMFVMRGAPTRISPGLVNDDIWHNCIITWDGSVAALYFDGSYIGNANNNVGAGYQGYALTVGNTANNTAGYQLYQGGINCVLVYNRALSATEVSQIYNITKTRFGR